MLLYRNVRQGGTHVEKKKEKLFWRELLRTYPNKLNFPFFAIVVRNSAVTQDPSPHIARHVVGRQGRWSL